MKNTFTLYQLQILSAQTGLIKGGAKPPENCFDFAFERDEKPTILDIFLDEKKALAALKKKCSYFMIINGFYGAFYEVVAIALNKIVFDQHNNEISSEYIPAVEIREI